MYKGGDKLLIDQITNSNIEYDLILCRPDETEITNLYEADNIELKERFPTTSELHFTIPYTVEHQGVYVKNDNFDLVKGDYLVKLVESLDGEIKKEKFFTIVKYSRISSNEGEFKVISAYSREHDLNKKVINEYNFISRSLYSPNNEIDDDGFYRGVMNYITTLTSWSVDESSFLNSSFTNTYRAFDIGEKSILTFLIEDVQPAFNCIFLFDTVNKVISVKESVSVGIDRDLYISEYNYLNNISEEINHDEIITRLIPIGKDGLTIGSINPTGTYHIDNFSFFKHPDFMPQGLIDALDSYNDLVNYHEQNNTFNNLLDQLYQLQEDKIELLNELDKLLNGYYTTDAVLIKGLRQIQDDLDNAILKKEDLTPYNIALSNKELEVLNKQAQIEHSIIDEELQRKHNFDPSNITSKQSEIDNVVVEIMAFNELIKIENNLTHDQLIKLDYYIRLRYWRDDSYETVEELYEEAKYQLNKLSTPPVQFEIDVVDFMNIVEGKGDKTKLILGDFVTIGFEKYNIEVKVRLVGYDKKLGSESFKLYFSNSDSFDDPNNYFMDIQNNMISASTTIDMSKFKWDKSENNTSLIEQILTSNLDAEKNKLIAGKDQDIIIDRRGAWFTTKDEYGNIDPRQLRIISDSIVFTQDGWQTASTAISPSGVFADTFVGRAIIGKQGSFEGIDVFDSDGTNANLIATLGKYIDSNNQPQRGLLIKNGAINVQSNDGNSFITGDSITVSNAGMTSKGTLGSSVRLWAGKGIDDRNTAPFRVTHDGFLTATHGRFQGNIEASNMRIEGGQYVAPNIKSDPLVGGSINVNNKFTVDSEGNMVATSGTFSGDIVASNITGSTITSNSVINVNTDLRVGNNIYLGEPTIFENNEKKIIFNNNARIIGGTGWIGHGIAIYGDDLIINGYSLDILLTDESLLKINNKEIATKEWVLQQLSN